MKFSEIAGNGDVKQALVRIVDEGRVPHAILFHENEGGGALAMIQAFLQYLNCGYAAGGESCGNCPTCQQLDRYIHPDVHYCFPFASGSKVKGKTTELVANDFVRYFRELAVENPYFLENQLTAALGIEKKSGLISVAEAKDLLRILSMAPVTDSWRAIVMWLPEKMNSAAANSLLKEIEEPRERTIFLLVTHQPDAVMQTITSRCLRIRIQPALPEEISTCLQRQFNIEPERAQRAASFCGGSMGQALYMLTEDYLASGTYNLFADLMDRILARDLEETLRIGEELAALDSREKQKAFCNFAGENLRKIFLLQQQMGDLAGIAPEEEAYYQKLAASLPSHFSRKTMCYLDRASLMLERNVNQKILFCNLVCRMFFTI